MSRAPMIVLSGPMGSGKTSVGRAIAARLGWAFVDLDERIANEAGASVQAIFEQRGESEFRAIERRMALHVIRERREQVVALGGGTVIDRGTRRAILDRGIVITLRAPAEELARRLVGAGDRPLLAGRDALAALEAILEERAGAYAECHAEIDTAARSIEAIATEAIAIAREQPIAVALGERSYRVEIGAGILDRVGSRARGAGDGLAIVVSDRNVALHAARALASIQASGMSCVPVVLEPGERNKTLASVERIWDAALAAGIDRRSVLVAIGGGVIGDLAGFAASTLLRGVALVQVPTSLLAMVDSSVGGKTGFDREQGKNLIGTFYQPRAVICDIQTLSTLDRAERIAGLAEIAKAAWIDGEGAVAAIERDAAALVAGEPDACVRAIRIAVGQKARIVAEDERESGSRALLNLGHTIGHAIEAASGYSMRHGEAVARGMIAAMRASRALGHAQPEHAARLEALLAALSLPRDLDQYLDARALALIASDKKKRGTAIRMVLPGAPGALELREIEIAKIAALVAPCV